MNKPESIRVHEDPAFFREAIIYTAAETGFSARLIEKDYFCTVLLNHLSVVKDMIFKGGTCLAKVHAGFYRLSEDLDFAVSLPTNAARPIRKKYADALRGAVRAVPPPFQVTTPINGHNNSVQYNGAVAYTSLLDGHVEPILVELSLREPLVQPAVIGPAHTVLLDPLSATPLVRDVPIPCIAPLEAFAEKFRAALSRRDAAIRDFFDLDHAVNTGKLNLTEPALVPMVKQKLLISSEDPINISLARLDLLRQQVDGRLRPVLRATDFAAFDLNRAFVLVTKMATAVRP